MPEAAGDGGRPAELCPEAGRIEADLAWAEDGKGARIECARAYMDCGRRHGDDGRLEAAAECFGRAVGLHGVWSECSDACGRLAARLEGRGRLADAVVWYGRAVEYADGARNAAAEAGDAAKEKKHRKRRSKWASACIGCWDALAGGARPPPPGVDLGGPCKAADMAAGGDDKRRARLRVQMGDIELGRGRFGGAAEWYGRALEIDAASEQAALGAGAALERDGQWGRASLQYEKAAGAIPRLRIQCAAGCARCASALESAGSSDEALSAIEAAAKLDASHALKCARMHHMRGDALVRRGREKGGGGGGGAAGVGTAPDASAAARSYGRAVEWYLRAGGSADAAKGCARCARALERMGLPGEALSAIEAAARLDASHALKCARMHLGRADALARQGRDRGTASADADAAPAGETQGAGRGAPNADADADAARSYGRAVEWYLRAAREDGAPGRAAESAKGCARCARALERMGLPGEALSAIEAAARLDASHALKCARMHLGRADALARQGRDRGTASADADAAPAAAGGDPGAGPGAPNANADAARSYGRAVEWYLRAAREDGAPGRAAESAKGCARCARALDRMGLPGEALSAIEAAAEIDGGAYALACGARCRRLADGLAKERAGPSRDAKRMYDKALAHYKAATAAGGPDAPRALLDSAAVCIKLGQHARAAGMLDDACSLGGGGNVDLRAECVDGICECACMLAVLGDSRGVGRCLELDAMGAPQDRRKCAERCSARGRTEYEKGRYEQAASCFGAAVSAGADGDPSTLLGLADSLARLGRHAEAAEHYGIAAEQGGGDFARAHIGMAGAREAAGRHVEASACLARAAEADPARAAECAQRCSGMGEAEYAAGRYEQAAACFKDALAAGGAGGTVGGAGDASALLGLADSLARLGRHAEAAEHYGIAAERGGGDTARALLGLADSLALLGRHAEAAEHYSTVAEQGGAGGDSARALLGLAGAREAAGRHVEASACLARAAEADPARAAECAQRCSGMGEAEYAAGRYEQAAACFKDALAAGGAGDASALLGLADSCRMAGRGADALREYSAARRSGDAGQRARAYAGLARVLAGESRHMDAAGLACTASRAADAGESGQTSGDAAAAFRAGCAALCVECGDAVRGKGRHDAAFACYTMALSVDPGSADANCGIGEHMEARGLPMDALGRYNAALNADGKMVRALVGAGRMRRMLAGRMPSSKGKRPDFLEAEALFERALKIDPGNFAARMGAGWACLGQKGEDKIGAAVSHFCAAAADRPGDADPRMAAGRALRKLARFYAGRGMPKKAADCHGRAITHYEHAMSLSDSAGILEPGYWRGVCMMHLGEDRRMINEFMGGVLARARPRDRSLLELCGRICDILGDYGTACDYYAESLAGSSLYTDGFHERIDRGRMGAGAAPAAVPASAVGTGGGAGGGASEAESAPAVYVLDANVVVECAADRAEHLDPADVSVLVGGIREGRCRIPQAAINEAYGVLHSKEGGDLGALRAWGDKAEVVRDHGRMDWCMKRAREALMTAWLYSGGGAKRAWRTRKFDRSKAVYTGGPPSGMDMVILATAAHLVDDKADGSEGPRPVVLVTSDADFLCFRDYIREVLSVDVEAPGDAARLLVRAARERERRDREREELARRAAAGRVRR